MKLTQLTPWKVIEKISLLSKGTPEGKLWECRVPRFGAVFAATRNHVGAPVEPMLRDSFLSKGAAVSNYHEKHH